MIHADAHTLYLWIEHRVADYLKLRDTLFCAPSLPQLCVTPFYDQAAGHLVLRLNFCATEDELENFMLWTSQCMAVLDPSHWHKAKRHEFVRDITPFRCNTNTDPACKTLVDLIQRFENHCTNTHRRHPSRAARGSVVRFDPKPDLATNLTLTPTPHPNTDHTGAFDDVVLPSSRRLTPRSERKHETLDLTFDELK